MDGLCNPQTRQCSCKSGVTGLLCDQCDTGFFDFSQDGCQGHKIDKLVDVAL